jgi:hypothetical protein
MIRSTLGCPDCAKSGCCVPNGLCGLLRASDAQTEI